MAILKGAAVERFLRKPDAVPLILLFGPDGGLVSERGATLARALGDPNDPFAVVRLDGAQLGSDPARLADEALTVGLFAKRRLVWVRGATNALASVVTALLRDPPRDSVVLIEAGDLKRGAGLREAVERDRAAVAIACYRDGEQDLARLAEAEMAAAGLTLAPEARALLVAQLGGDRLASRGELTKLALYARGKPQVTAEDVRAVVGDVADFQLNDLVDAAAEGVLDGIEEGVRRAAGAGVAAPAIATVALRHFEILHRARSAVETGESPETVLGALRPPLFPQRRERVARQARRWRMRALETAIDGFGRAALETRRKPALAYEIVERALLDAATLANGG